MAAKRPPVLDRIDIKILAALQRDGRSTNDKLAATVALSPRACLERVRRLEAAGIIVGYQAVIELARTLSRGKRPKRTILFVLFGSEELGGPGNKYFLEHSPVPLDHIAVNLEFEMIGRPDPAVPAGQLWLTGFERSNLGPELVKHGAHLVADPHPKEEFFQRSDNYALAQRGIVAQTISSFGLHQDYHRPSDELSKIDFNYMTTVIESMVKPVSWLADTDWKPAWTAGGKP